MGALPSNADERSVAVRKIVLSVDGTFLAVVIFGGCSERSTHREAEKEGRR